MAMDLFCYSSRLLVEVRRRLEEMAEQHEEIFAKNFLISPPREADEVEKQIAAEFGFNAQTIFLVRYNVKGARHMAVSAVDAIKNYIGKEGVLILFENEIRQ